jgi:hypothetical protein
MRRIAAVIVLLAAATVVAPAPATAAGLPRVVSKAKMPAGIDAIRMDCPLDLFAVAHLTTAYRHVFGAGFPPSGTGTLSMLPAVQKLPGLGMQVPNGTLADLTTLKVSVYNKDAISLTVMVRLNAAEAGDDWELQGKAVAVTSGYATYSIFDITYSWLNLGSGDFDGSGTIDDFLAANPQHTAGFSVAMFSGDCSHIRTRPVYFDHVDYVSPDLKQRFDFEAKSGGLSIAANHGTIARGNSVRLSTVLKDGGVAAPGATVTLWALPVGAGHFTKVRTKQTNANGAAFATLKPTKTTTYQWRHAKDAHVQATHSLNKIVHVTR